MSLKGYAAPVRAVEVPGNEKIVVRGLSLTDLSQIARQYRDDVEPLFAKLQGKSGEATIRDFDVKMLGSFMLQSAPAIAAFAIALAADEPDQANVVAKLPVTTQIELVYAIGDLTFQGEGGAKKVIQIVTNMLVGARGLAINNNKP